MRRELRGSVYVRGGGGGGLVQQRAWLQRVRELKLLELELYKVLHA